MSVGRHTVYNLTGAVFPMALGLLTVPVYLHLVGMAAYGVLAIIWMFLGYFGAFDPGLSRATAFHIAKLPAGVQRQRIFWTAICINTGFGVLGGLVLYAVAGPVLAHWVKMPAGLRGSVVAALPWLAAAVPVGTVAGVLAGTLEGVRKFALINLLNMLGSTAFQVVPLGLAWRYGANLTLIIAATVLIRLGTACMFLVLACIHAKAGRPRFASRGEVRALFAYGGWITISNLIIPFYSTFDKLLIGGCFGVVEVTLYTVPDNLTRRMALLPGALSQSLFPEISAGGNAVRLALFERSLAVLMAVLTPCCLAGILGMQVFLHVWLGADFANRAAGIGVVLLLAIFVNSLAYLPCMYLQATGRPDLNAKFHLLEMLPHLLCVWWGIHVAGLIGVAYAMLLMSSLDAVLLFHAADMWIWARRDFQVAVVWLAGGIVLHVVLPAETMPSLLVFAAAALGCAAQFGYAARDDWHRLGRKFAQAG